MRLAGKDYLNGTPAVIDNLLKPFNVMKNQRWTLILSKTADKAYCQRFRIKQCTHRQNLLRCRFALSPTILSTLDHSTHEFALEGPMNFPELIIRNIHYLFPDLAIIISLYYILP